uniref:dapper homolog 2 n=1 Tax=Semicossyphus pulcher TaxID=241346 RepID=UPI0037E72625
MLSRKTSGAGLMSSGYGAERSRVGERLQAALAGLQELKLLRDRQSELVTRALRGDREDAVFAGPGRTGAEELRLEATLKALKQQLSRLQKQDVGLKTHLQQLDQQISELKLDVRKATGEQQESDSRPSSGFYELSDGGSLSNSCTSVYSQCLSSSQSSLLLGPLSPSLVKPPSQPEVCRRRSADEGSTQHPPLRASGLHLGSSRIRASSTEQARQRPVSTGDLEVRIVQGLSCYKPVEVKKPSTNLKAVTMELKFQSSLVSRTRAEVYQYPSPLHAVALQSPIFFQGGDQATPGPLEDQGPPGTGCDTLQMVYETKTLGYIDKLLLRSVSRIQNEAETLQMHSDRHKKTSEGPIDFPEASQIEVSEFQSGPAQTPNIVPPPSDQKRHCMSYSRQQLADNTNHHPSVGPPQVFYRYSCPAAVRESSSDEVASSSLRRNERVQSSEKRCEDHPESRLQERKVQRQRSRLTLSSGTEETHTASPEFVHARFVPAGSQRVKVRQADRRTRALKLRKPRALRQQHSSTERTRETGSKGDQRRPGKGKVNQKYSGCHSEELRPGSGSDSSPCSPGLPYTHKVHGKHHPIPVAKSTRVHSIHSPEYEPSFDQRKRRQGELIHTSCVPRQRSRESQVQVPSSARPGQWTGPSHSLQSSKSSTSFLRSLNSRYPPAPFQISSLYPTRCESEYSAECASLFHSTIAGSSEGELSDNTTNRFGDSESSQSFQSSSDSDSSLSLDQEDQEDQEECLQGHRCWAEAGLGPLQQPPPLESSACRIKASRALKKKIRRFQPASLKVMTLV